MIEAVSVPFSAPGPRQNPTGPWDTGQNSISYLKRVPGVRGSKALGSENPIDCTIARCWQYTSYIAQDIYVAAWYASGS